MGITATKVQHAKQQLTRKPSRRKGYARQRRHTKMAAVPRWPSAAILDIIEPEIAPFDPPIPKTLA